jgi:hypothetical protein
MERDIWGNIKLTIDMTKYQPVTVSDRNGKKHTNAFGESGVMPKDRIRPKGIIG